MERVVLGVRARERGRPSGMDGAEHVLVGEEVVKAQVLGPFANPPHSARVSAELGLRVDGADLHGGG